MNEQRVLHRSLITVAAAVLGGLTLGCVINTSSSSNLDCGDTLAHSRLVWNNDGELVCVCDPGYVWEDPGDRNNYECDRDRGRTSDCTERYNLLLDDGLCYCEAGYTWCSNSPNDYTCCYDGRDDVGGTGGVDTECGDPLTNSEFVDGTCYCEAGFERCTNDPSNYNCCAIEGKDGDGELCSQENNVLVDGQCFCDTGYDWCTDDPNDFSCCEVAGGTGGTGGEPGTMPDPAACNADTQGSSFCSNTAEMGPEGSILWVCTDGQWVEDDEQAQAVCEFDNFDFAYGCVDTGDAIEFICGNGPGTACDTGEPNTCTDDTVLESCVYGKLTRDDCFVSCTEVGDDDDITYDHGECLETDDGAECACCDAGTEGCPA